MAHNGSHRTFRVESTNMILKQNVIIVCIAVFAATSACSGDLSLKGDGEEDASSSNDGSSADAGTDADAGADMTRPSPNTLDQDKLFTCGETEGASSPARIRRLTPSLFNARFAPSSGGAPYSSGPEFAFSTDDGDVRIDQAATERLVDTALILARSDVSRKIGWPACIRNTEDRPGESCLRDWLEAHLQRAWQRPGVEEEVAEHVAYAQEKLATHERDAAFEFVVARIYASPNFLFRQELGSTNADEYGRKRLSSWQTADALVSAITDIALKRSYHQNNTWSVDRDANLVDAVDALLTAAEAGLLTDRAEVERHARALLDAPPTLHRKSDYAALPNSIHRFFEQWLGHSEAPYVFKSGGDTPPKEQPYIYYGPGNFPESMNATITLLYQQKSRFLEQLLTTRTFVFNTDRDDHGWPYNLADGDDSTVENLDPGLVDLPENERAGLLTHPAWLTAHSLNQPTDPHPVHRGRWVRENLLCGEVPQLPIGVQAQLPEDPTATVNERLRSVTGEQAQDGYCWSCHQNMDPLGMPFEVYDHYGRFRTEEIVGDGSLVPVDANATLVSTGDPNLDGMQVGNAIELAEALAQSERVEGCFVRQTFRYFMGRAETYEDACALRSMRDSYQQSGGSFQQMLVTLFTSDVFLYRHQQEQSEP